MTNGPEGEPILGFSEKGQALLLKKGGADALVSLTHLNEVCFLDSFSSKMTSLPIDPVLSCSQSLAFEKEFFKGDEGRGVAG